MIIVGSSKFQKNFESSNDDSKIIQKILVKEEIETNKDEKIE